MTWLARFLGGAGLLAACGGTSSVAVPGPDAGPGEDAATAADSAPPSDSAAADAAAEGAADAGPKPTCTIDADCTGGKCFEGLCICNEGLYVQVDGTCGSAAPPATCPAAGGTCVSGKLNCPALEPAGTPDQNRTCGDFQAGLCCFASCRGKDDFVCCATGASSPAPAICVNDWRTCASGQRPVSASSSAGCTL